MTAFLFVAIRFHCNAGQLLKFMLAAITSLSAATMSTSNKISFGKYTSYFALPVLGSRRASLQLHFGAERFESSYRFSLSLSLYASSRKTSLNFRGTFPPPSHSFPSAFLSFFFFFFSTRFPSLCEGSGTHPRCSAAMALPFDGKGRHSSRISSHLNGSGYKYATGLGDFMRTAPAPRLFSIQFSRLIRSNFAADLA